MVSNIYYKPIILEEFAGTVDSIHEGTAYVTLVAKSGGEELEGEYPAADLEKLGIFLDDRFVCKTVLRGGKVKVVLEYLPVVSFKKSLQ